MPRFCPLCGKSISSGDFCRDHSPEKNIEVKEVNLKLCSSCNSYFEKGSWKPYQRLEVLAKKILITKFGRKIKVSAVREHTGKTYVIVWHNKKEIKIPLHIEYKQCEKCSLKGAKYFQGILQIRNADETHIQKLRELFTREEIKHRFITKEVHKGDSMDLFVSSNKTLDKMSRELKKIGAKITRSSRLFSKDSLTSKELYRGTVLAVFPKIKVGDIIELDGYPIKVNEVSKVWKGVNLETGKTIIIKHDDKFEKLRKTKAVVNSIKPYPKVLDPESYQEVMIQNPDAGVRVGEHINIVKVKNKIYQV